MFERQTILLEVYIVAEKKKRQECVVPAEHPRPFVFELKIHEMPPA